MLHALIYNADYSVLTNNFLISGALMQAFEGESLIAAEKVAGSWLANAKWRQQSDGSLRPKIKKSNK